MSVERSAPRGAIFLSYASQDAEAARRICEALRAGGVEVWLDQSELAGGDAWDQKIRQQIKECALFVPIISANTQARREGYFRREWKQAAARTHDMADGTPFILPVVIDATRDADSLVPDEFRVVQWTRWSGGQPTSHFIERVKSLLDGKVVAWAFQPMADQSNMPHGQKARAFPANRGWRWIAIAAVIAMGGTLTYFATRTREPSSASNFKLLPSEATRTSIERRASDESPLRTTQNSQSSALPSGKSIAVLPFANLSPDAENAFFTDGMHEELLTALAKIRDLKVISRTSVLAYRDPAKRNLRQIAAELGVAHVLEGSVRREGNQVRITVQLIDAATDAHRWADNYTGRLTDVFQLQADISTRIAQTLAATLSPAEKAALVPKLTRNPVAYDLYLKGKSNFGMGYLGRGSAQFEAAITKPLEQAVAMDSTFAAAWAALGQAHLQTYTRFDSTPGRLAKAKDAIDRALHLDPTVAEGHVALGFYFGHAIGDWPRAVEQYAHALALVPGHSDAIYQFASAQFRLGRWAEGMANFERVAALDPAMADRSSHGFHIILGLVAQRLYRRAEEFAVGRSRSDNIAMIRYLRDRDRARYVAAIADLTSSDGSESARWAYRRAMLAGRFAEAVALHAKANEGASATLETFHSLHYCHAAWLAGDREGAKARALRAIADLPPSDPESPRKWRRLIWQAKLYAFAGEDARARQLAAEAVAAMPIARDAMDGPTVLLEAAEVHLVLAEKDRALDLLEHALSVPSPVLYTYGHLDLEAPWAPLLEEPRYKAALAKMTSLD